MRILLFNESTVINGGVNTVINSEVKGLREKGIEVKLLTIDHKELLKKTYLGKINLYFNTKKKIKFLNEQLEAYKPELIHIHNIYPFFRENIWSNSVFDKYKKVFHLHNFYPVCLNSFCFIKDKICYECLEDNNYIYAIKSSCYDNSFYKTYLASINRPKAKEWTKNIGKFDHYIAVSNFLKEKYIEFGLDRSKITEITNGMEFEENIIYNSSGDYILFLSNVVFSKGIDIVCKLAEMNHDIKFVIAGKGRDLERIKINYKDLDNLEYVGYVENEAKKKIIKESKMLLFPVQSWEAFGLVIIEALSFGKPVVTSGYGGTSELVIDGLNGIIVKSNKLEDYNNAISSIWNNHLSFSNAIWQIHLEKYSIEKHINSLVLLYNNLLSN